MNMTENQIKAELNALPDSSFIDGQGIDQILGAGVVFRHKGKILTVIGFAERKVWDDASDHWVTRRLPGCRPATEAEKAEAGITEAVTANDDPSVNCFAIVTSKGSRRFAVAGKRGGSAVGDRRAATTWATRAEAEAAIPAILDAAYCFFPAPVVVQLSDAEV